VDYHVVTEGEKAWHARLRCEREGERRLPEMNTSGLLPENIAAAAQAALLLGVAFTDAVVVSAVQDGGLTGRRQHRRVDGRHYVLDVAHNPASVNKLHEYIASIDCNEKKIAVFAAMADKDLGAMLRPLSGVFDAWFLAELPQVPRAAGTAQLADLLRAQGDTMISVSKNLRQALRRAQSVMAPGDLLVVFGSFHTVAAVLPVLDLEAPK
jgi:dihydrofolate synthase/folylpolyglutamate synthase